jgi:phosphoribosyl 1,2-cyclic phosphodiesterase
MTFIRRELPFCVRGTYGGNSACVEIQGGADSVLCDAGTGLRDFGNAVMKAMSNGRDASPKTFHLFMSHLHWDHIQGFPFFSPAYLPGCQIRIYGCHPGLQDAFACQQNPPFFPVPLSAMSADISFHTLEEGRLYEIAGFQVTGIKQRHPGDSYGYRFLKDGKKVVYSTDAEHQDDAKDEHYPFVEFFRHADLLIFDAQYHFWESVDAKANWGHSSNLLGVELGLRAGVKRLCLFHHEPTFDDDTLDQFLSDTRTYQTILDPSSSMEILLAYDGLTLDI